MIRPIKNFLLIDPDPVLTVSEGGIHIPDSAQKPTKSGIVIALGPDCPAETEVQVGDHVYFEGAGGFTIFIDNKPIRISQPQFLLAKTIPVTTP